MELFVDEIIRDQLDEYTKRPEDGNYDAHTRSAMVAMFNIMNAYLEETYHDLMVVNQEIEDLNQDLQELSDKLR